MFADVGKERLVKEGIRLQGESHWAVGLVGMMSINKSENELLYLDDVEKMQESYPIINKLKKCYIWG